MSLEGHVPHYGGYDTEDAWAADDPRGYATYGRLLNFMQGPSLVDGGIRDAGDHAYWNAVLRNPAPDYTLSCSACGRTRIYHGTPHPHWIRWCLCGAADTTTATGPVPTRPVPTLENENP